LSVSFYAVGILACKSCVKNVDEIETGLDCFFGAIFVKRKYVGRR